MADKSKYVFILVKNEWKRVPLKFIWGMIEEYILYNQK